MARTIRDASLESRAARSRLKARGKPYYRTLEPGLHLGYRRPTSGAGKWVVRHYVGDQAYAIETIATADDFSDADGVAILDFRWAQAKARERMVRRAHIAAGKTGPLTVRDAVAAYLDFLETNRKSALDARYRASAHIFPKLGEFEVESLTTDHLRHWHTELAKSPARVRTKKDAKQQYKQQPDGDENRRRRKSSANRTLTILKAALNRAWRDGRVPSDTAWRRVEAFESVDATRIRYLTIAEAKRLINAADTDFRTLINAALQSGARYGELARLTVADFNPDAGSIAIREPKNGKPRHVVLTDEGMAFFKQLAMGRIGDEPLIRKSTGEIWRMSHQTRPMARACKQAKIKPAINFHGLRHTYASLSIMNGAPLLVVAKNLGHADTRMVEKHYGHLAPSYVADAIRAAAPRFGTVRNNNIRPIG
jgi:integrase